MAAMPPQHIQRRKIVLKKLCLAGISGFVALVIPISAMAYPHTHHYGRSGYIRSGRSSGYLRGYNQSGYIHNYGWSGYAPQYGSIGYNRRYNPYNHNPFRYNHSYNHLDKQLLYPSNRWQNTYRYDDYAR